MKWITEFEFGGLIPSGLGNLGTDPAGIIAIILLFLAIASVIIIYISSALTMYRTKRIKYLGLDTAPLAVLELPARINIYDKFLIRNYKSKDIAARNYFNEQYKIAMRKKELEDTILESQKQRFKRNSINPNSQRSAHVVLQKN